MPLFGAVTGGFSNNSKSAGTSISSSVISLGANTLLIAVISKDNTSSAAGDNGEVTSVTYGGNNFTKAVEYTQGGSNASSATVSIWYLVVPSNPGAVPVIANFASCTAKTIIIGYSTLDASVVSVSAFAAGDSGSGSISAIVSGLTNGTEYLVFGGGAIEAFATYTSTLTPSESLLLTAGTSGGGSASNISGILKAVISSAITSASMASADSSDKAMGVVVFSASTTAPINASVTDSNPAASDSATAVQSFSHNASVTDSNLAAVDSATTAQSNIPSFNASVTDSNPAESDSVTVSQKVFHTSTVTDSNAAEVDSATASQTVAAHSASVTDSNPAEVDTGTATHIAPVINASVTDTNAAAIESVTTLQKVFQSGAVTDSNSAEVDSSTATHISTTISAAVTDSNSAATDSSTASQIAPTINASVTDSNAAQVDSATANQATLNIAASISDTNAAEVDTATANLVATLINASVVDVSSAAVDSAIAAHIFSSNIDAVVIDISPPADDVVYVDFIAPLEPVDHQWDNKTLPVINSTVVYHVYTGAMYKVMKIFRFNPKPPKRYQYACAVTNILTNVAGRADVWYDEEVNKWYCNDYKAVTSRDVDGVIKTM